MPPSRLGLAKSGGGCCCGGTPTFACSPCNIPEKDLTVCWYNTLTGDGSTPLVYNSSIHHWTSACFNELKAGLSCPAGAVSFSVTYWLTGTCEGGGQQQTCGYPGVNPFAFTLFSSNCSGPFLLDYRLTNATCQVLGDDGYTRFVVTDGGCP